MKVIALVRSIQHPQYNDPHKPQLGDIVQFRRADTTNWKQFKDFAPVLMDLNIPCGNAFKGPKFAGMCGKCKDKAICEFQKYMQPEYNVAVPEEIIRKRRYQTRFIPETSIKNMIDKGLDKTDQEKQTLLMWAKANEYPKSIIYDHMTQSFEAVVG